VKQPDVCLAFQSILGDLCLNVKNEKAMNTRRKVVVGDVAFVCISRRRPDLCAESRAPYFRVAHQSGDHARHKYTLNGFVFVTARFYTQKGWKRGSGTIYLWNRSTCGTIAPPDNWLLPARFRPATRGALRTTSIFMPSSFHRMPNKLAFHAFPRTALFMMSQLKRSCGFSPVSFQMPNFHGTGVL
jgi:hypothetical protein